MMNQYRSIPAGNRAIAIVQGSTCCFTDEQSALDFMMTVKYETGADAIILPKALLPEEFFDLKTKLAGSVLQKYINYSTKLAIVGDFSGYTSKSLADFIRESNRGKDFFFVATQEQGIEMLTKALNA